MEDGGVGNCRARLVTLLLALHLETFAKYNLLFLLTICISYVSKEFDVVLYLAVTN